MLFSKSNKYLLAQARKGKYAIGAFNASGSEQIEAIIRGAINSKAPGLIVATSEGEGKFVGFKQAKALIDAWKTVVEFPIYLHLDHGKSFEIIQQAIEAGYDSVHYDCSELTIEENINELKRAVAYAHKKNVFVEGELGFLRGKSQVQEIVEVNEKDMTDPKVALDFAKKTGIDSLAVIIGNFHGIATVSGEHLNIERLKEISKIINIPLVLHGGSGIPNEEIKIAIGLGISKINVNTEIRVAFTEGLKEAIAKNPGETTPYKIFPLAIEAVGNVVKEKIGVFTNK
jgi:ketose-bisphosphate aldolase